MLADEQVLACDIAAQFCCELDVVISLDEKEDGMHNPSIIICCLPHHIFSDQSEISAPTGSNISPAPVRDVLQELESQMSQNQPPFPAHLPVHKY